MQRKTAKQVLKIFLKSFAIFWERVFPCYIISVAIVINFNGGFCFLSAKFVFIFLTLLIYLQGPD